VRKSKRAIGYVRGLARQNQYAPSRLQITDQHWPYHWPQAAAVPERSRYVSAIREAFLGSGGSIGRLRDAA
jgi:hypothetical protein